MDNQSYRFPISDQEPTDRPRVYFRLIFSSAREIASPRERTYPTCRAGTAKRASSRFRGFEIALRHPAIASSARSIPGERVLRHPRVPVRERIPSYLLEEEGDSIARVRAERRSREREKMAIYAAAFPRRCGLLRTRLGDDEDTESDRMESTADPLAVACC